MSYTPTVWRTGDVITAEKLNKIEEGIANAGGDVGLIKLANVTVNYSEDSAETPVDFGGTPTPEIFSTDGNLCAQFTYGQGYMPIDELGTINNMKIPIYDNSDYYADIANITVQSANGSMLVLTPVSVESGDAVIDGGALKISGDCVITLKAEYAD